MRELQKKKTVQQRTTIFWFWVVLIGAALVHILSLTAGVEQIDHVFEKSGDYETMQYVNLFEKKDATKNYRVKAKIWRVSESSEDGGSREARLQQVYFSNGGSISFEDSDCNLKLHTRIGCGDSNGDYWYIELTSEKP